MNMLDTGIQAINYLQSLPIFLGAGGYVLDKTLEGGLNKVGENLVDYMNKKYRSLLKKIRDSKGTKDKKKIGELAKEMERKVERDDELKNLIFALGREIKIQNQKIEKQVRGNDYSKIAQENFIDKSTHIEKYYESVPTDDKERVKKNGY